MGSSWKAVSDDSRRRILLLLKKKQMTPNEIANYFNFSLPAISVHLKILKEAKLIVEEKKGRNRIYKLNTNQNKEMIKFFERVWDYKINSLKEFVENKGKRRKKWR